MRVGRPGVPRLDQQRPARDVIGGPARHRDARASCRVTISFSGVRSARDRFDAHVQPHVRRDAEHGVLGGEIR